MKTTVRYLNDQKGNTRAVQLPISEWRRLMNRLTKYERMLKVKSDLAKAFGDVKRMYQDKIKKQSLQDFLNEL